MTTATEHTKRTKTKRETRGGAESSFRPREREHGGSRGGSNRRGTRGRPDRPALRRCASNAWRGGKANDGSAASTLAAERSERLAVNTARAAATPGTRDAFARRFRARLLEEVERVGTVDAAAFVLAHSRAALATWRGSGLHPLDEERVRLEVLAEERAACGVEPVRGAAEITPWGDLVGHGRPRRGGKR